MSIEDHPKYKVWRLTLDRMIEAETRCFVAFATPGQSIDKPLADLHRARQAFWGIADTLKQAKITPH